MSDSYHACVTGDCDHDNANDCVKAISEHAAELEDENRVLRDECKRMRQRLRQPDRGKVSGPIDEILLGPRRPSENVRTTGAENCARPVISDYVKHSC